MQMERAKPIDDSRFRILTEISQQITSILDINERLVWVGVLDPADVRLLSCGDRIDRK